MDLQKYEKFYKLFQHSSKRENMKEKIYRFLLMRDKAVPLPEIMEKIFCVKGNSPPSMEKIVIDLLHNDPRFIRNEDGRWTIKKEGSSQQLQEQVFTIIDIEKIKTGRRSELPIAIGIFQVQRSKILSQQLYALDVMGAMTPALRRQLTVIHEALSPTASFTENAWNILLELQSSLLVHLQPAQILSTINYLLRSQTGMEIESATLSLKRLARKLAPRSKIRTLADIADLFHLPYPEPMDLLSRMNLYADILDHMLDELKNRQIFTHAELLSFLEKNERGVDFSRFSFDEKFVRDLPETPGVYLMKDQSGSVFYVGKAKNLKTRVHSYFIDRSELDEKSKSIFNRLYDLSYQQVGSELEALLLEYEYIMKYKPEVNTQINIRTTTGSRRNIILILPHLDAGCLYVLFIKGMAGAQKIVIKRQEPDWQLCREMLRSVFFDSQNEKSDFSTEQLEIIWRWLHLNQDTVNYIDVDQVGALQRCLDRIKKYVTDEELFSQKIEYI